MKKYLVTLATAVFAFGLSPLGAQDQAPSSYGQTPAPYGNQSGPPYSNPNAPSPYGNQNAPDPYNQGSPSYQGSQDNQSNQGSQVDPGAQGDQSANGTTDGQPGVGRVSYVQGDVSSQRGDNAEWVALTLNAPVAPGDRVSTSASSRAEVQLDAADILRLSANSTVNVVKLNRTDIQVQIGQGLASYNVVRGSEANTEIDTPNASIHPNGAGEYRVVVDSDSQTRVTIRSGSADITTPQGSTHVDQGQMITVQGTDDPQYRVDAAAGRDDFDGWNDERNHLDVNAQSWHKTNPYYTGSEDLDRYGVWSEVPDYGQVWTPSDPDPNWAPYRAGRWVWEPYYGWTWVSSEPWGWAPYHYGRWFVYGGRWSWWPGPVAAYPGYYPVWAPAYVSFFGWGGGGFGVGVGFGFGTVGWFPIGPCDWFHPWWGGWGGGFHTYAGFGVHEGFGPLAGERGFGGRRFSNVDGIMHDGRVQGGISSMSSHDFGRGAVPGNQQRFNGASLHQASLVSGKMPISPSRESFSPSGRSGNANSFRNAPSRSQHFFSGGSSRGSTASNGNRGFGGANNSSTNSGGSRPGSFERPFGNGAVANRSNTTNGVNRSAQGFGGVNTNSQSGWQRFSPSSRGNDSQGFNNRGTSVPGGNQRSYQPQSSASRGAVSNSYSRSPLNMRQPIVTPRSGNSGSNPYGGSRYGSSGSSNSSRGSTYSSPRSTYSAPQSSGHNYSSRGSNSGGSRGGSGGSRSGGGGHHR